MEIRKFVKDSDSLKGLINYWRTKHKSINKIKTKFGNGFISNTEEMWLELDNNITEFQDLEFIELYPGIQILNLFIITSIKTTSRKSYKIRNPQKVSGHRATKN